MCEKSSNFVVAYVKARYDSRLSGQSLHGNSPYATLSPQIKICGDPGIEE